MDKIAMTSRQMQAERTKRQIFDAAMRLLERQGFDSITVRDIVREAGASVGSFYNAYPTKLDVFYETYRVADNYFDTVVRPGLTQGTAAERIAAFFGEYALYNSETSPFALTKVLYNPDNACFHRHSDRGMLAILTQLVREGIAGGELKTAEPAEDAAEFFMVCIRGVVYDWCTCNGQYDLKARVGEYTERLLKAFA